uniref:Uncharacterized protein n=1 Tax=Panagrolaimus davidi TaxID=227884 RepID=A0A914P9B1_9BILA
MIGDQATFDAMLVDLFSAQDEYRFIDEIIAPTSIAFAKASAYREGLHVYEYLLKRTDNDELGRPSIIFDMIAGNNATDLVKYVSIEPYSTPSSSIECAAKISIKLQNIYRRRHNLDERLAVPLTSNGSVLLNYSTTEDYFSALVDALRDISSLDFNTTKKTPVAIFLDSNAPALWNITNNEYRVDGAALQNNFLLRKYETLCMRQGLRYIETPFSPDLYLLIQLIMTFLL